MEFNYGFIIVGVIVAIVLLYLGFNYFIKNKDLKDGFVSTVDIDALLEALGGKENVIDVKSSPSKLTVSLKDRNLTQIDHIRQLGASGIVEGKDNLSMIFGKQSALIEEDLKRVL